MKMNISKIIKEEVKNLMEVRYLQPYKDIKNKTPLSDDETIVVYHGFNKLNDAQLAAKFGITGKERAKRIYSYEAGNNPNGLFVTIEFITAKQFSGGVIVEFATKVSNLEAPVWAGGGSYFVQGQYTKSFNSPEEREDQRNAHRDEQSKSEYDAISQSDRPELAYSLYEGSEKQALFIGDLNPNMIRAFWVNSELIDNRRHGGEWERLSTQEFGKRYVTDEKMKEKYVGSDKPRHSDEYYGKKNKILKPADDFNPDRLKKHFDSLKHFNYDEFVESYIINWDNYVMNAYFYPKQIEQIKKYYNITEK